MQFIDLSVLIIRKVYPFCKTNEKAINICYFVFVEMINQYYY